MGILGDIGEGFERATGISTGGVIGDALGLNQGRGEFFMDKKKRLEDEAARTQYVTDFRNTHRSIFEDETISERTRHELLRDIQSLAVSDSGLHSKPDGIFSESAAKKATGFSILELDGTADFADIQKQFEAAKAGEGKYGARQNEQNKRELLRDTPGERQFLVPNSKRTRPASPASPILSGV